MGTFRLTTDDYTIDLPEGWAERPSAEGREFASPDGRERVRITVLGAESPLFPGEPRGVVDQLSAARQKTVRTASRGYGDMLPLHTADAGATASTSLVGTDPVNSVTTFCRIVATHWRAVTVSYDGHDLDPGEAGAFAERSEPICESLHVSEAAPGGQGGQPSPAARKPPRAS